ncbi:MAG: hypothetical protein KKG21_03965, partial [Candidatus Omnitrophica bacterium]|nr:hypothetical protein [Candidatus Omnitrophota bacterium]
EVKRLLTHISSVFGVDGIVNPERRWKGGRRKEYYRINFNVENGMKLWKLALPYMPQISSINTKFSYVYDSF